MQVYVKFFTEKGRGLAFEILDRFKEQAAYDFRVIENLSAKEFAQKAFEDGAAAVFIGAVGIAVRSILGLAENKLEDIPVVVIDESGSFVIPVLSGHVGGANELALAIAKEISGIPVITTATDVNSDFAIDVFAKKNELIIKNKEGIKEVSKKVLAGHPISILTPVESIPADVEIQGFRENKGNALLYLAPKPYAVGIGCKRGKDAKDLKDFLEEVLEEAGIAIEEIFAIASIDLKAHEPGLVKLSKANRISFVTFSADALAKIPGEFSKSEFVDAVTGVDCVCERAAMAACKDGGELIVKKVARDGMTIAIARRNWRIELG